MPLSNTHHCIQVQVATESMDLESLRKRSSEWRREKEKEREIQRAKERLHEVETAGESEWRRQRHGAKMREGNRCDSRVQEEECCMQKKE